MDGQAKQELLVAWCIYVDVKMTVRHEICGG